MFKGEGGKRAVQHDVLVWPSHKNLKMNYHNLSDRHTCLHRVNWSSHCIYIEINFTYCYECMLWIIFCALINIETNVEYLIHVFITLRYCNYLWKNPFWFSNIEEPNIMENMICFFKYCIFQTSNSKTLPQIVDCDDSREEAKAQLPTCRERGQTAKKEQERVGSIKQYCRWRQKVANKLLMNILT